MTDTTPAPARKAPARKTPAPAVSVADLRRSGAPKPSKASDKSTLAKVAAPDGMSRADREILAGSVQVALQVLAENVSAAIAGLQRATIDPGRATIKFPSADENGDRPAGVNVNLPVEYDAVSMAGTVGRKFLNVTVRLDGAVGEALFPFADVSTVVANERKATASKAAPAVKRPSRRKV